MKTTPLVTLVGLALSVPAAFAAPPDASKNADTATVDAMALYSSGSAVIQNSRQVNLKRGEQRLSWPVSRALQPDTLWLSGDGVRLNGFNVPTRDSSETSMLAARVGRKVTVTDAQGMVRHGTLVDTQGDTAYVRVGKSIERVTAASPVQLSWPAPGENDERSGIDLNVTAEHAGKQKITATYQTGGPSWQARYTGRFDPKSGALTLTSAAIIDNSGHDALNADRAWLVAGDISRAHQGGPRPMVMARKVARDSSSAGQAESVGDVYRYPLKNGLHVAAGQTQSIALMKPVTVDARRHYRMENYATRDAGDVRRHAQVSLSFANHLKQPLPAGPMRVYDAGHAAQLSGTARIQDTPVGAPVRLSLGEAFDVTTTHRVTGQQRTIDGSQTIQVTVALFNAADNARSVTVIERLPGNARLADGAPKTSGGSASAPEWQVQVPANGRKRLRYTFTRPVS